MASDPNKPARPKKDRKAYKKPTIRSAQFYEKRALACTKTLTAPSSPDCAVGFTS